MMPYLTTISMLAHFTFDLSGQFLQGKYQKQVLRLHFPNIANELEQELEIDHVSIPYATWMDKKIKDAKQIVPKLANAQRELEIEIELYQTMQEEVYRLREKLHGEPRPDQGEKEEGKS